MAASASLSVSQVGPARFSIAIATPLAGAALAYLLWWISDRLLYIGPLDRAAFGWLVVVPVWALTPFSAAYACRPLSVRQSGVALGVAALVISGFAAVQWYLPVAFPDCEAARSPAEWIGPAAVVGAVIGGGLSAACLAASLVMRRGRWWSALLVGAGSAVALVVAAAFIAFQLMMPAVCQRPPLT